MVTFFDRIRQGLEEERALVAAVVTRGPGELGARMLVFEDGRSEGSLGTNELDRAVCRDAVQALYRGAPGSKVYSDTDGETEVFFDVYPSPPTLLIFGGVHIGVALARLAKQFDFRVRVIDARGKFANSERFPDADEIVIAFADDYLATARLDSSTYVVVLSHDPKLDDPALLHTLGTPVRYIGAIGSKNTNAKRLERLRAAGIPNTLLARIHAPIGLDIGAQTPEEIALSILGEMIAAKNGRDDRPLPIGLARAPSSTGTPAADGQPVA
ncbi:MAG: XdhC family protein [Chloroflexi bacterium]|nr:XdhC family protein [Chloroflexota bacterium]